MSAPLNKSAPYLLSLFKADIKARLVEAGVAAVLPAIEAAADEALADLKLHIEERFDVLGQKMLVNVSASGLVKA